MAKLYETITAENWWKRGLRGSPDGLARWCLAGHIVNMGLDQDAGDRVLEAIMAMSPKWRSIASFNDDPDTMVDDVIRVCKLADV